MKATSPGGSFLLLLRPVAKIMVNPSTESSPDAHSASNVGADDKGNSSATTRSEASIATTIPPDPPADDKADEKKQEEDKKEATILAAAAETKPQPETTAEISASSNHEVAESKPEESSVSGTATAMQSKSENGTREGTVKGEDENVADHKVENTDSSVGPVVSATKRTRPPYKYDPEKVTLRFLFANKDGLTVTVECKPGDTVGDVKGQLLSVWPEGECRYRRASVKSVGCI